MAANSHKLHRSSRKSHSPLDDQYAYVTLFSNDNYLPGVLCLQRSCKRSALQYPLIVMVTSDGVCQKSIELVQSEGCIIKRIGRNFHPDGVVRSRYARSLYAACWNKLLMWEWEEEFDRLIYLDADMIILKNIDHLFRLPDDVALYGVGDCFGGRQENAVRDACCHFNPNETPTYFNAGFWVIKPNKRELESMKSALVGHPVGTVTGWQFAIAEQDFLNEHFQNRWRPLPYIYNAQKRIKYHHPDLYNLEEICVLHFVDEKPWDNRHTQEILRYKEEIGLWWEIYRSEQK